MNALTLNMGADAPATMSSREIAELTGKQHAHVMRDIRAMTKALGDDPNLDHHKDTRGYVTEFFLPRDLTMTLVTGYRVDLRYKVIKRLEEYDSGQADPIATLNDPAAMRGLLLTYAEKVLALTPKARALDRIAETSGSMSITEAAKYLQIGPKRLIEGLQINGYIYRSRSSGNWLGYQDKIDRGLIENKCTTFKSRGKEKTAKQVRITHAGMARMAMILANHE